VVEVRIANTISRRLYALMGSDRAVEIRAFQAFDKPEETLALPRLDFKRGEMAIYFPANFRVEQKYLLGFIPFGVSEIEDPQEEIFRNYISGILGLNVEACDKQFEKDSRRYAHKIVVPYDNNPANNRILHLLQRDLGLRELPEGCVFPYNNQVASSGRVNCWNEFLFGFHNQLGLFFKQHGQVDREGLKLSSPRIVLPENLPEYTREEIRETLLNVLVEGGVENGKSLGYVVAIENFLARVRNGTSTTEVGVKVAMRHFIYELKQPPRVSKEVRKNSVINVALGARSCIAGFYVRLTEEIQRVAGQEKNTKNLLLALVEEWKNDTLMTIFANLPQSVHAFAAAQVAWGKEFGLDIDAGKRDPNREGTGVRHLNPERENEFRQACTNPELLVQEITRRINQNVDNHGSVMDVSIYEETIRRVFVEMGLDNATIDQRIEALFPSHPETYTVSLTEEAIKILLTQIGLLNL